MNKQLRKAVIAGNWKMNKTPSQTAELINEMKPLVAGAGCDVILCVPFTNIAAAVEAAKGSNIKIGAQNLHFEKSGAFTGEVSADMLKDLGVEYVIIGHSERREYFAETDITVNKKIKTALASGLTPIMCCGETLEQREQGIAFEFIPMQIKIGLMDISADEVKKIIFAYEPIWAIGTGKTATSDQAQEVNAAIRATLTSLYGKDTAEAITIQYGGSMNAKNAAELLAKTDVDGGLIGGASLKAADFAEIVSAATKG